MQYCQFNENCITSAQMNLIFRARLLWRNAATWMRAYLANAYSGLDTQEISIRLHEVNLDYGNTLRLFFGDQITEEYINLLDDYVAKFHSLFSAQMNGDENAVEEYKKQLYQNIDQRSNFLSRINPFWQEVEIRNLLYTFTDLLIEEADSFIENDYRKNVQMFDRLMSHSSRIGDYFSEGLFNFINYSAR